MYATEKLLTCNTSNCILNTTSFNHYDKHSRAVFEILDVWRYGWNPFMQSCGLHKETQEICNKEEQLCLCYKVEYINVTEKRSTPIKIISNLYRGNKMREKVELYKRCPHICTCTCKVVLTIMFSDVRFTGNWK